MELSNVVAARVSGDRELLDLLKAADPKTRINRGILLELNAPKIPAKDASEAENESYFQKTRAVGEQAEQAFSGIEGLQVHNLMKSIACASVSGTAGALAKAIELDCVRSGILGDRQIFRGATRG